LNRTNYKQWFAAAKPAFIVLYSKDFENHPQFAHHWQNADAISKKERKKARGLIRREILKRIRQAFKSIAPKPSEVESEPA
jgi:DNA-binding GntR family transcriptional regulator